MTSKLINVIYKVKRARYTEDAVKQVREAARLVNERRDMNEVIRKQGEKVRAAQLKENTSRK